MPNYEPWIFSFSKVSCTYIIPVQIKCALNSKWLSFNISHTPISAYSIKLQSISEVKDIHNIIIERNLILKVHGSSLSIIPYF